MEMTPLVGRNGCSWSSVRFLVSSHFDETSLVLQLVSKLIVQFHRVFEFGLVWFGFLVSFHFQIIIFDGGGR